MEGKRKQIVLSLLISGIILMLVGTTVAFFNYTRTGSANTLAVGRISFESSSGPAFNVTNVFPISRDDIDTETDSVGTITINITGDTTYTDGVEYLISAVDVVNISGTDYYDMQKIPISIDVSFSANGTGKTIGTENNNYFNEGVRGGNTSYYKILAGDIIKYDKPLIVGYIAPGETGIDGNITIKSFLDEDLIAISDTYPEGPKYIVNPNMTQSIINTCVNYLTSIGWTSFLREGETLANYCNGTGTVKGSNIIDDYKLGLAQASRIQYFIEHDVLVYDGYDGTSYEWINGRTVLTTNDWHNLQSNGLSFKIKIEANEGIWVDDLGKIDTCPNCQFIYFEAIASEDIMHTTWNTTNQTPTVINNGLSDSYLDIVNDYNTEQFFGVILNESNQVTRLYNCTLKNSKPLCLEATSDGSLYSSNRSLLQSEGWWGNNCENLAGSTVGVTCILDSMFYPEFELHEHGCVSTTTYNYYYYTGYRLYKFCDAASDGYFYCSYF